VEDAIHRDASVRPKQRNQTRIRRLDATEMSTLVAAGSSERWRVAIALAGYAGLRLGELRGLRWSDIDLEENQLTVSRALLPKGEAKPPKTEAGKREVPLFPELRRALVAWKLRSPGPARATTCSARRPAPPSKSAA
jgi:integrase